MSSYIISGRSAGEVRVPGFMGLCQEGGGAAADPRFAAVCSGAETEGGVLRPMAEPERLGAECARPIRRLYAFYRRWYGETEEERALVIGAGHGRLYFTTRAGESWTRLPMPPDLQTETFRSDEWSACAYELNPEGAESPVDVLLLTNRLDGMVCLRGDTLTLSTVQTPKKFGVIARYMERVWGAGIDSDPDMLVYSAAYDPLDWSANPQEPEEGAGDVQLPTWDGDGFVGLIPYGSTLLALKRDSLWRLVGTTPGEYAFTQQFGGGTPAPRSVVTDESRVYMLGNEGLLCYGGDSVSPILSSLAPEEFRGMNREEAGRACGCLHKGRYYLAFPGKGSRVNDRVLVVTPGENRMLLRKGLCVECFLSMNGTLYFSDGGTPGGLYRWQEEVFTEAGRGAQMVWQSPWMDLGRPEMLKSGFTLTLTAEALDPGEITVTLCTERGMMVRRLPLTPGRPSTREITFPLRGRRFAWAIESGSPARWRLRGGLLLRMELE